MIIEYTLFNLSKKKVNLLYADLAYLKADVENQLDLKLKNIQKDRGTAHRLVTEFNRRIPMLNLTVENLKWKIEKLNEFPVLEYTAENLDENTVKVKIEISNMLDFMETQNAPLIGHFASTKKLERKIENTIKDVYTKEYTFKVEKEGKP